MAADAGGGLEVNTPDVFAMDAPQPKDVRAAHSLHFQALGDHSLIGLALYLPAGLFTWRTASWNVCAGRGSAL